MVKAPKSRRINTKVSEGDYRILLAVVREYGFKSMYQLLQALLLCLIRHVDSVRDAEYEDGIGAEIGEMFDELMEPQPRCKVPVRRNAP